MDAKSPITDPHNQSLRSAQADAKPDLTPPTSVPNQPIFVLEPSRGWISLQLMELWEYRELFYFLVSRNVKIRYSQTLVGAAWAVIQPLLTMVIFSIFFGHLGKMPSDGIPYPLFSYAALLLWQLFATTIGISSKSLVVDQQLITKIYFPRLIIPIATVFVGLLDFVIAFVLLIIMMGYYGIVPTPALGLMPVFVFLTIMFTLGISIWLAALNVFYRDIQYVVPFLIQIWLFATPIAYPSSLVPAAWQLWYSLNPMVGLIEGFRWSLLGHTPPLAGTLIVSTLVNILLLISGLMFFKRMERTFADIV